ncbi:Cu(I)-responsive transcriptional regulator [Hirschia maritima]|uniref:Cu(I)-responsive transcriptional regulator n=1 Tax=Hirschia maritima TaxID=1121961 RepID=UPI000372A345|nr:Cu(I)-responsive transcriptional regulator [Hirschia maritima]
MNISKVAKIAQLPTKTVRYYSEIGLVAASGRTEAGYRDYSEQDARKLCFVRRAREFGFSIEECRSLLSLYEDRERSSSEVKALAQTRLDEIEQKQRELQSLHTAISHLIKNCSGDHRPDCPIIDYLEQ